MKKGIISLAKFSAGFTFGWLVMDLEFLQLDSK